VIKRILAAVVLLVLLGGRAAAKPVRFGSRAQCTTEKGSGLSVPPGAVVLPPEDWSTLDAELRRLQAAETRLKAENSSLKDSGGAGWGTWVGIGLGLAAGAAGVWYLDHR
jgi:hypothetical protein